MKQKTIVIQPLPPEQIDRNLRMAREIREAAFKALDALSRYKFLMFGYHAGVWVKLNRIQGNKKPNPFARLVQLAKEELRKL